MASAASIMRSALRTTSSRAFRWSRVQEMYAVIARPSENTTSRTRLNLSLRPIRASSLALLQPGIRPGEPDQAERHRMRPGHGPRRPEPELHPAARPALELLDQRSVARVEHGGARIGEPIHRDHGLAVDRDADVVES